MEMEPILVEQKMEKDMAMEYIFMQVETNMKDSLKMVKNMEKESSFMLTEIGMKDSMKITVEME